ncbi:MAG TPA: D-alanyl-D-alanine carboxypeptidase/D-alanyl-D-alanine-endopeptidase [Bryobacteraceae bacterium]|jgi:D-alanyl-D-alanine carboxypeptidase/D-alanyl-D-alanine-endopeptidase (penicillin-binding protein 4)
MKRSIGFWMIFALAATAAEPAVNLPKPPAPPPKPTPAKLQRTLMDILACVSPGLAGALIGIDVIQLSTGRTIAKFNPQNQFAPASNAKLYTTATALMRLGPDYRYETRVTAATAPDSTGSVGDLYFIGGGDPTLASRNYPLATPPAPARGLADIEDLADQVVASGVKRIDGAVIGDDTAYPKDLYPTGWTVDDSIFDYGAPVSALTIHDNLITVRLVAPMAAGALTSVALDPPLEYFTIDNRVTAGSETRVNVERLPGSRQLLISGTLAAGAKYAENVALDDPPRYAATALADALERRGVSIRGGIGVRSRGADEAADPLNAPVILAKRVSGTLPSILLVIDKISHNLYAEMVLREVGRASTGSGTRQAGIAEVYKLLWDAGVRTECCYFQDGSGLSRQTLISPISAASLLEYMFRSQYRDIWWNLLPIGGVDGTLGRRFDKKPEAKRIRAKTGSIAHVATMSGYAESTSWGPVAFSLLVNNYNSESSETWQLLDRIALALLE